MKKNNPTIWYEIEFFKDNSIASITIENSDGSEVSLENLKACFEEILKQRKKEKLKDQKIIMNFE